jgi:hypothetical protein
MATGPEHYAAAEQQIANAKEAADGIRELSVAEMRSPDLAILQRGIDHALALAQVHATLALAASQCHEPLEEWRAVLGGRP